MAGSHPSLRYYACLAGCCGFLPLCLCTCCLLYLKCPPKLPPGPLPWKVSRLGKRRGSRILMCGVQLCTTSISLHRLIYTNLMGLTVFLGKGYQERKEIEPCAVRVWEYWREPVAGSDCRATDGGGTPSWRMTASGIKSWPVGGRGAEWA